MEKLTNKELIKLLDEQIAKQENKCNKISNQVQTLSAKERAEKEPKIKELNEKIEIESAKKKKLLQVDKLGFTLLPVSAGFMFGAYIGATFGGLFWALPFMILSVASLISGISLQLNKKHSQNNRCLVNLNKELEEFKNQKSEKLENLLTKEAKAKNVLQQLIEERNTLVKLEKIKREKRRYITNRIKKQRENNEELTK